MKSLLFFLVAGILHGQVNIGAGVSIGGATALPVINLGVQSGVDCTGTNDSSSGINTVFASISGKKVVIPVGCLLKVTSQLQILDQTNFAIQGEGFQPNLGGTTGPLIFGCSGAAGPVLYVNRSSYWSVSGFGIYAKGASCSSSFTGSMAWANITPGGYTSTFANIGPGMSFETNPNGATISGYFAFGLGINSSGSGGSGGTNLEQLTFHDNFVHCQNSSGSYGLWVDGGNADNGSAINNRIDSCFQEIRVDVGSLKLIEKNHFAGGGAYSVFGGNGADIFLAGCASGGMSIIANEASDGGPFINTNNDVSAGGCPVTMIGNVMGVSDIGPSAYPINLGAFSSGGLYTLISNQLVMTASTTATAIGASGAFNTNCTYGPLGNLVDINNTVNDLTKLGGWSGCVGGSGIIPFQSGEYHQFSPLSAKTLVIEQSGTNADLRNSAQADAFPDVTSNTVTCNTIGRIWFDITTTTTVEKHCLNVSGTLTWVTK